VTTKSHLSNLFLVKHVKFSPFRLRVRQTSLESLSYHSKDNRNRAQARFRPNYFDCSFLSLDKLSCAQPCYSKSKSRGVEFVKCAFLVCRSKLTTTKSIIFFLPPHQKFFLEVIVHFISLVPSFLLITGIPYASG